MLFTLIKLLTKLTSHHTLLDFLVFISKNVEIEKKPFMVQICNTVESVGFHYFQDHISMIQSIGLNKFNLTASVIQGRNYPTAVAVGAIHIGPIGWLEHLSHLGQVPRINVTELPLWDISDYNCWCLQKICPPFEYNPCGNVYMMVPPMEKAIAILDFWNNIDRLLEQSKIFCSIIGYYNVYCYWENLRIFTDTLGCTTFEEFSAPIKNLQSELHRDIPGMWKWDNVMSFCKQYWDHTVSPPIKFINISGDDCNYKKSLIENSTILKQVYEKERLSVISHNLIHSQLLYQLLEGEKSISHIWEK